MWCHNFVLPNATHDERTPPIVPTENEEGISYVAITRTYQVKRIALPLAVIVAIGALWYAATEYGYVQAVYLPHPADVFHRILSGFRGDTGSAYLWDATLLTLQEAVVASLCAATLGIPLGCAMARWKSFAQAIQPIVAASQAVPAVAIAPLLVVWIGYGFLPIVVLCIIMVIFPIIVSTTVAISQVDRDVISAARLDGAGSLRLLFSIILPLASPGILGGIRTGFTLSITGAIVGEMIIGGDGLGTQLAHAQPAGDMTGMFAIVFVTAFSAIMMYLLLLTLESRVNKILF